MDPLGSQCSSSSSDQTEGKSEKGRDSPSSFPSLALDPLSPTQLCKLGAVRHTASLHWMPVCAGKCVLLQQVAVSAECNSES